MLFSRKHLLAAGLLLALITNRCFFSNAPVFLHMFASNTAHDWLQHEQKLKELSHTVQGVFNINTGSAEGLSALLIHNLTELLSPYQSVVLENDFDYSAPFVLVGSPDPAVFRDNLCFELQNHYAPATLKDCSFGHLQANPLYRDVFRKAFPRGEAFWALASYHFQVGNSKMLILRLQKLNAAFHQKHWAFPEMIWV